MGTKSDTYMGIQVDNGDDNSSKVNWGKTKQNAAEYFLGRPPIGDAPVAPASGNTKQAPLPSVAPVATRPETDPSEISRTTARIGRELVRKNAESITNDMMGRRGLVRDGRGAWVPSQELQRGVEDNYQRGVASRAEQSDQGAAYRRPAITMDDIMGMVHHINQQNPMPSAPSAYDLSFVGKANMNNPSFKNAMALRRSYEMQAAAANESRNKAYGALGAIAPHIIDSQSRDYASDSTNDYQKYGADSRTEAANAIADAKMQAASSIADAKAQAAEVRAAAAGQNMMPLAHMWTASRQGLKDLQDEEASYRAFKQTPPADFIRRRQQALADHAQLQRKIFGGSGPAKSGSPADPADLSSFDPPAGKRAKGGAIDTRPYLVGEEGPELFVPEQNGTIIPNPKTIEQHPEEVLNNLKKAVPRNRRRETGGPIVLNDDTISRMNSGASASDAIKQTRSGGATPNAGYSSAPAGSNYTPSGSGSTGYGAALDSLRSRQSSFGGPQAPQTGFSTFRAPGGIDFNVSRDPLRRDPQYNLAHSFGDIRGQRATGGPVSAPSGGSQSNFNGLSLSDQHALWANLSPSAKAVLSKYGLAPVSTH